MIPIVINGSETQHRHDPFILVKNMDFLWICTFKGTKTFRKLPNPKMFQTAKAQYRYDKIINRYFDRREKVSVFTLLIKYEH